MQTLLEQVNSIKSIDTLVGITDAYQALNDHLNNIRDIDDIQGKLLNYQMSQYMANVLQTTHLNLIKRLYDEAVQKAAVKLSELFGLYKAYTISLQINLRHANTFAVDIAFTSTKPIDGVQAKQPSFVVGITCDKFASYSDITLTAKTVQKVASVINEASWYDMQDDIDLQRVIMKMIEMYDVKLQPIIRDYIDARDDFGKRHNMAVSMHSTLMEDNADDMFKVLQSICEPVENFCMYSVMPVQANCEVPDAAFEVIKYRVSYEKINNINVDSSSMLMDEDGEMVREEQFIRYTSIRKKELPEYLLNNNAMLCAAELEHRTTDENMFIWLKEL